MDDIRYPNVVDFIKNIYLKPKQTGKYKENIIEKIRQHINTLFGFTDDNQFDTILFHSRPVDFRNAIFGDDGNDMRTHMNRGKDDDQCEMSTMKGAGKFEKGKFCWICGNKIIINPKIKEKQYNCEHIIPVLRAVMFTGLLNQQPWQKGALGDETPFLARARNENYLWSHTCCNILKSSAVWFTFDEKKLFIPDPVTIKESLKKIVDNADCNFVTPSMMNSRINNISKEMQTKCNIINLDIIYTNR